MELTGPHNNCCQKPRSQSRLADNLAFSKKLFVCGCIAASWMSFYPLYEVTVVLGWVLLEAGQSIKCMYVYLECAGDTKRKVRKKCCHLRIIPRNELGAYTQLSRVISWRMDWGRRVIPISPVHPPCFLCAQWPGLEPSQAHGATRQEAGTGKIWQEYTERVRSTGYGQRNWQHLPQ